MTKATELRELPEAELLAHIKNARRELFGLRFQHATGELENSAGLNAAKKEIARALTVAKERGIEISNG